MQAKNDNLIYGYTVRYEGVKRRMNQLSTNDPRRAEMQAKLIELEGLIASPKRTWSTK